MQDSSPQNHEMYFKIAYTDFSISVLCSSGSLALAIEVFVHRLRLKTYCFQMAQNRSICYLQHMLQKLPNHMERVRKRNWQCETVSEN